MDAPLSTPDFTATAPGAFHAAHGSAPFELEPAVESGTRRGLVGVGGDYARHDGWGGPDTKDEWLTPPQILRSLGSFDLDPCAPEKRPWEMAAKHYTWRDNGLLKPWTGRVWLNPPYGLVIAKWLARMAEHRNGIVMIFARTESEYWHKFVWPEGDGFLFLRGRVKFCNVDGTVGANTGPAPSVLIAYGAENVETLKTCGLDGAFLPSGRRGCGAGENARERHEGKVPNACRLASADEQQSNDTKTP